MKKHRLSVPSLVLFVSTIFLFFSCKKVNESTELGGPLVPEIDNVTTFETFLATETDNRILEDTNFVGYQDPIAIGAITNDPEFGQTIGNGYFNISSPVYHAYPFTSRENLVIDSVVLSLRYSGIYGDSNSLQTVRVYEVAPTETSFNDDSLHRLNRADFATTGPELGSATFIPSRLKDSVSIIRKDTVKVANVLRIRLSNSLGQRFANFDTNNDPATGGFYNDTLFKQLFRGLAIKAEAGTGNGLAYFLPSNASTNLTVYYKATINGVLDQSSVVFTHRTGGQANTIRRTAGGGWATYLGNGTPADDKLYIQSTPGSFGSIRIPALSTFSNSVIHLAELVVSRLPSAQENIFTAPPILFLDHVSANDSVYTFPKDMQLELTPSQGAIFGTVNFNAFGGRIRPTDNKYHFNITGYVQDLVIGREANHTLRLSAPYFTEIRHKPLGNGNNFVAIPVANFVSNGRVVVAGGSHADPALRLQLRVVYSKI